VRHSVPAAVLLQDLSELLLAVEWKLQALRFWSALIRAVMTALPETYIFKQAGMDGLAAAQQSNKQSWAAGLLACAQQHGMNLTDADGNTLPADESAITAAAAAAVALEQQELVDRAPGPICL